MPRPRKQTREEIEDYFGEMPVDSQAEMLRVLQAVHRVCRKRSGEQPPEEKAEEDES